MPGCYAVFHKQLGDLLLLEPAMARLCDHHGAPVRVLTRTGHAPLLELMDGITYQGGLPLHPHQALYCYDPLNKSALRSVMAPVLFRRCILPEKREMQWFHRPLFGQPIVPELGDRYVAEYFWDTTPVPAQTEFRPPRLQSPPIDWKPAGLRGKPYVLLNPTSGWRQKCWLADRWAETLRHLHDRMGWTFLMTSATTDWQVEHCREIANLAGNIVRSPGQPTSLRNFLWLCANARAVLTVDGAASHLAQAFQRPSLTLFGPTNMGNWHFDTAINRAIQAPPSKDGTRRLKNLPAEAVFQAAGFFE